MPGTSNRSGVPMRPILPLLAAAVALASTAVAQKPDFSGTWKLNLEKSDPMGGPGGGGRGGMGRATELVIIQSDSKLTVEEKSEAASRLLSFYLDGRESRNPGMRDTEMVSKSSFSGASLVTEGETSFNGPNGAMTIKMKTTRTLSADGKTMTVEITSTSPRGEMTRKLVYDKQ